MRSINRVQLWRASWIVLLPFLSCFVWWASNTWQRYVELAINQMGDGFTVVLSLQQVGDTEFLHFLRRIQLDLDRAFTRSSSSDLENVSLFVSKSDLNKLNADLPASGREYVPGAILNNGHVRKVRLKYRGDFQIHWGFFKKSWRIKTRKSQFFDGLRKFNLIVPKTKTQYSNYVGYRIAHSLGALAPRVKLVTLTLNGEFQGLYLLAEQLDESTLRDNGLVPGDIYAGDQTYGEDYWKGIVPAIFDHPGLWDKMAIDNHYPEDHRAPLRELLRALKQMDTDAGQRRLEQLLDLDAFARINLLEVFFSTRHFDTQHNWKLYYDPARGKFRPLIWDPLPWYPTWQPGGEQDIWLDGAPPPYIIASTLMQALHMNANFLRVRNRVFEEYFASDKPDQVVKLLASLRERLAPVIERDAGMLSESLELTTPDEARAAMEENEARVKTIIDHMRRYYVTTTGTLRYSLSGRRHLLVEFDSWRNLDALELTLRDASPAPGKVVMEIRGPDGTERVDVTQHVRWQGNHVTIDQPLTGDLAWIGEGRTVNDFVSRAPVTYTFHFPRDITIENAVVIMGNDRVSIERDDSLQPVAFRKLHGVTRIPRAGAPLHWEGSIAFDHSQTFSRPVEVSAGTDIRLGPDVSLTFLDTVSVAGTPSAPVTIGPSADAPWGTFLMNGPGTAGSSLRHFSMWGGSGFKDDLHNYTGMLSVHDTSNIVLSDCRLHDNSRFDDMFHAVYAQIKIDRCRFEHAPFDAIDLDMSSARLSDLELTDNGNDGLDLMGTTVVVTHTRFVNNGDKGISVGERSDLWARDNVFEHNSIGVQSKDDSIALVADSRMQGNGTAIDAYKKNWRYGTGGSVWHCGITFLDNEVKTKADKQSFIGTADCASLNENPQEELQKLRTSRTN